MKVLKLLGLLLALSLPSLARARVYGWCEQGNRTIDVLGYTSSVTTPVQRSFPQCTVTVYLPGTLTLAAIYADDAGTVLANPFTLGVAPETSTIGYWFFYADDGRYDVNFSGTGITTPFTLGDIPILDPALFHTITLAGAPGNFTSIGAAYAAAPSTGAWVIVGPGRWTEPATIALVAGKPLHVSCAGGGAIASGDAAIATVSFNVAGYMIQQAASDVTSYVATENCSFNIGASATGWLLVGSTSTNYNSNLNRYGWAFTNTTVTGAGENVSGSIGMQVTQLVGLTLNNFTIQRFEQTAIFDRCSVIAGNHTRFAYFKNGPLFTKQGGSGTATPAAAQVILSNPEFLGPSIGTGTYPVTVDQIDVEFIQAIYEPVVAPEAMIHITANGRNFRDFGGFFSYFAASSNVPAYLMVWDDQFTELAFFGTQYTGTLPAAGICVGTPTGCAGGRASGTGSQAVCVGCSASVYSQFAALNPNLAIAFGATPLSYEQGSAITGPLNIDTFAGPDVTKAVLNKNGAVNDVLRHSMPMPSPDRTATAAVGVDAVTEAASMATVSAGMGLRVGTQAATVYGIYCTAAGLCTVNDSFVFRNNQGRSGGCTGIHLYAGVASPNASQNGCIGDLFLNMVGGASTTLYVKESGNNTNTGWVAK